MKFGEKLQSLLNRYSMTQEDLAFALQKFSDKKKKNVDFNRAQIGQWAAGFNLPSMERAIILCEFFNITLDMMFNETHELKGSKIDLKSIILN